MDGRSQAALEVAHSASADSGSLGQPFLRQSGRHAEALEGCSQLVIDLNLAQIGELNGE